MYNTTKTLRLTWSVQKLQAREWMSNNSAKTANCFN